ncbi:MAG TPA: helix-turn-helix domain-containing protein [Sphingomonas sp.]|uniref:helix-turn-helix domain-containing protein n=1 Tax=Sphingomonas sp. TaxID=28214 RepID=UPI002EDA143B
MIEGGTELPAVSPRACAMPPGLAIRYDRPADDIADSITGYHVYSAQGSAERVDWFLPGTANIRIALDAGVIAVTIRRRTYSPIPAVTLFGPTSQAMRAVTHGGTMIGIGVSALGWSRLFAKSASTYRDRIVPLAEAADAELADALFAALSATDRDHQVKAALDAFFRARLGPYHADAPLIRRLMGMIVDEPADPLAGIAAELNLPAHTLRRLSTRHFGFPPKLLLLRARFLRSLTRLLAAGEPLDYSKIAPSYFDASHFLRDARAFLGTTPKRFVAQPTIFLQASLRAREAVLGAPTQALHAIAPATLDAEHPAP